MARFELILTTDYEVWGDGSGNVKCCMIEPSARMLDIADHFDAKITFFLDVAEYWAFKDAENRNLFTGDYRPASMIESQLKSAVKNGHDVQMHLHPQWLKSKIRSNEDWKLDFRLWRIPEVEKYAGPEWTLNKLISNSKATLEHLFKSINPEYRVTTFRAGAWSVQPEENVIKSLISNEIFSDSSVAPGRYFDDGRTIYDFRQSCNAPYWKVKNTLIQESEGEMFEIPIATVNVNTLRRFLFLLLKIPNWRRILPEGCERGSIRSNVKSKVSKNQEFLMLNFADGTSYLENRYILNRYMQQFDKISPDHSIPIVAISHPKTFGKGNALERFLNYVNSLDNVSFSTYPKFISSLGK